MLTETRVASAAARLLTMLEQFGIPSDFAHSFADAVYQRAIVSEPWSTGSLLVIQVDPKRPLNLDHRALPTVTYFNPLRAAACAADTALAILHVDRPPLAAFSALAALLALREVITPISAAETLVFLAAYESEGHSIRVDTARGCFSEKAKLHTEIEAGEFDSALCSLQHLGCLWRDSEIIKVADRIVIRN